MCNIFAITQPKIMMHEVQIFFQSVFVLINYEYANFEVLPHCLVSGFTVILCSDRLIPGMIYDTNDNTEHFYVNKVLSFKSSIFLKYLQQLYLLNKSLINHIA
jgi:hypothetical protein